MVETPCNLGGWTRQSLNVLPNPNHSVNCKSTLCYAFDPWERTPQEQWQTDYVGPFKRLKEGLY